MTFLIIYLTGVLIAFAMIVKSFYDDWKQGMDIQFCELFFFATSLMSWITVVIFLCVEHWNDVVIKGKSDGTAK